MVTGPESHLRSQKLVAELKLALRLPNSMASALFAKLTPVPFGIHRQVLMIKYFESLTIIKSTREILLIKYKTMNNKIP